MYHYSKNPHTRTHIFGIQADWVQSYISGILGEISLKVFLSVLNLLLLKKCKGFTNYDEIHNFGTVWLTLWQMVTFILLHIFHVIIRLLIPNTVVVHLLHTASEITSIYTEILVQYHSKATDTVCSIKLKRKDFLYIRTIFNFQFSGWMCSYIYAPFLPNFSLSVLNPHILVCGISLY